MGFRFANFTAVRRAFRPSQPRHRPAAGHHCLLLSPISSEHHSWITRRWHVGHTHHGDGDDDDGEDDGKTKRESDAVFRLGLAADVSLAAGKALTGYVTGSTAIIADAAHSVSDIVLSGVALWSYNAAKAPKDKEHPYGHGKFETLGTLGISCMLLVTAGGIAWHAVDILQGLLISAPDISNYSMKHENDHNHGHVGHHHGVDLDHPVLALSMTLVSISVKEGLYWITKRAGEREGSGLMKANAWHHRADAVSSVVALIGVGGAMQYLMRVVNVMKMTGGAILGVPYLDPLAGLVVSGMIFKAGVETGYQSIMELVDAGVPLPVLAPIKQTIVQVEGVKGCHRLRGRKAGSSLYLDVHIEVDPFLSVSAAHDIGESVRHEIQKFHKQVTEVFIHIDPSLSYCSSLLNQGTEMDRVARRKLKVSVQKDIETIVYGTLSSLFPEKMSVEHITWHSLQGNVYLQVQVSMPPDLLIRDAMDIAKVAENKILEAAVNVNQVSIQLRLGHPISQLHLGNRETRDFPTG